MKRIKSEQSFISNQKIDSMKKLSIKCKVYVTNPFIRKLSRNVENSILEKSKIVDNESSLSQSGCKDIKKMIGYLWELFVLFIYKN